jgi:hypothetical protein
MKQLQKEYKALSGIRARRISSNESVPRIEIWLGNLVENMAGVVEAGER